MLDLAVIGAGRMGRVHLEALRRAQRVRAVAVVDPSPEAREASGLRGFGTVEELLAAGGARGRADRGAHDLHLRLVTELAGAGLPILCEKPLGLTVAEAEAATKAAEDAGVLLQVGYWRRFVAELGQLRRMADRGDLGAPRIDPLPPMGRGAAGARLPARSGGIAVDMAVHEIDQVRWLLAQEFGTVGAAAGTPLPPEAPPGDADVAVAVAVSGGAVAVVTLGRRFPAGDSCWVELFAGEAHERSEFMCGPRRARSPTRSPRRPTRSPRPSRAARSAARTGADAVAALRVAERIDAALRG